MSCFQVLMPLTVINWLINLRKLGKILSLFCMSLQRRDKEASDVSGIISTHLPALFWST